MEQGAEIATGLCDAGICPARSTVQGGHNHGEGDGRKIADPDMCHQKQVKRIQNLEGKSGESMMRFELSLSNYERLCLLVKAREWVLRYTYQKFIGALPPWNGQFHHIKHKGSGGPDREDNLILLSVHNHLFVVHGNSWRAGEDMCRRIDEYMASEEVAAWRRTHQRELEELYATEAEYQLREKQQKHRRKRK